jgi:menaquinone-9 beta-reductase
MTDLGHNAKCDYDLVIAGCGPAGSTAAIVAARRGLRVLLMERGGFPRHKVCGEFVSSESLALLRDLLQGDDHALANALPIKRFRVHVGSQVLEAPVDPPAAGISRHELDATLMEAAQRSGADCRMQSEVMRCEHSGHFILQTSRGQLTARAVINASGRWSRLSSPEVVAGQQSFVGCKAHFIAEDVSANTGVELFFGHDGYCGVQPVWAGDAVGINVCAMLRPGTKSDMRNVLQLHPALAERSRHWRQFTPTVTTAPLQFRAPVPVRDRIFQAGDAAAFIDPFVGDGIAIALRTGVMAAEAAADFCHGASTLEQSCAAYCNRYEAIVVPALRNAARLRRLLSLPAAAQGPLLAAVRATRSGGWLLRATRSRMAADLIIADVSTV